MTNTQLINFIEDHGAKSRFLTGVRIVGGVKTIESQFQVLDVRTYEGIEFADWVAIEPTLYSVKNWLGY